MSIKHVLLLSLLVSINSTYINAMKRLTLECSIEIYKANIKINQKEKSLENTPEYKLLQKSIDILQIRPNDQSVKMAITFGKLTIRTTREFREYLKAQEELTPLFNKMKSLPTEDILDSIIKKETKLLEKKSSFIEDDWFVQNIYYKNTSRK